MKTLQTIKDYLKKAFLELMSFGEDRGEYESVCEHTYERKHRNIETCSKCGSHQFVSNEERENYKELKK